MKGQAVRCRVRGGGAATPVYLESRPENKPVRPDHDVRLPHPLSSSPHRVGCAGLSWDMGTRHY